MPPKLFSKISGLSSQPTSHNTGIKKVFLSQADTPTSLTQFSYGELKKDEIIEPHLHPTMEEYYYFIAGKGTFKIADEEFDIEPGSFIRVPSGTLHTMKCAGEEAVQFVYFGIAL